MCGASVLLPQVEADGVRLPVVEVPSRSEAGGCVEEGWREGTANIYIGVNLGLSLGTEICTYLEAGRSRGCPHRRTMSGCCY